MTYISAFKINLASQLLQQGQIIAYPTEAIYGLGCDPLNERAVHELLTLKQRPMNKGLILIASSLQQLQPYLITDQTLLDRVSSTWPGPTTWIIPAQAWVPKWLTGQHTSLAVRVTAHPLVVQLCESFGSPIVSTSANISDRQAAQKPHQILKNFGAKSPYIIKSPTSGMSQATAIFDAVSGQKLR